VLPSTSATVTSGSEWHELFRESEVRWHTEPVVVSSRWKTFTMVASVALAAGVPPAWDSVVCGVGRLARSRGRPTWWLLLPLNVLYRLSETGCRPN
jgi:hypothetical protein